MTDQWPMFGCGPGHAGHDTTLTRPEWPVGVLWRHGFDGQRAWEAPTVDERGRAFVHVKRTQIRGPNFRAIGANGQLLWALRTGSGLGPFAPSPAVDDGTVILPDTPKAWVVDGTSGGRIYETTLHPSGVKHVAPTVANGRIYAGFRTFNLQTGDEIWSHEADGPEYRVLKPSGDDVVRSRGPTGWGAGLGDDIVIVAGSIREGTTRFVSENEDGDGGETTDRSSLVAHTSANGEFRDDYEEWGHVHALEESTGDVVWAEAVPTPIANSAPVVVTNGHVYVVDCQYNLRVFDGSTGTQQWTVALDSGVAGRRPAVAAERSFVATKDGALIALDVADGTERWRFDADAKLAGPPAIADGVVHVSDVSGGLYALDVSGDVRWTFNVEDGLRTGPSVANGRLFVAGESLDCIASAS